MKSDTLKKNLSSLLISTDLDGSLLDHSNYSWHAAKSALTRCLQEDIPIIFNTSKSQAETETLQKAVGLQGPYIVENGSAVIIPKSERTHSHNWKPQCEEKGDHWLKCCGTPRTELLHFLSDCRQAHDDLFESFNDWSLDTLINNTGLTQEDAIRAQQRAFSEPLLWKGNPTSLRIFEQRCAQHGYRLLQGGRFIHLMGQTDKGQALNWLVSNLYSGSGRPPTVIALGDSENDRAMLTQADIAINIRSSKGTHLALTNHPHCIKTQLPGPSGWNQAILQLLETLKPT